MLDVSNIFVTSDKGPTPKIHMALNDKQKLLTGEWQQESAENSDALLKKIGIGLFLRQIAKIQKPLFKLTYSEETGTWHMYIESAFKNHDYPFKINEKFLQTTIDGRHFWCSTTLDEEGVQTDSQERTDDEPNNIPAIVKRWVQDDKLIITEECDDIMSRRTFTRVIDNE